MTLIVGIRCSDGIVIAADSAATLGSSSGFTITQPTQKIEIIDKSVIVACVGSVGMAQRFAQEIGTGWAAKAFTSTKCATEVDAGVAIANMIRPHILAEAQVAQQLKVQWPATAVVVAMPIAKKLSLIEIADSGAPEVVPHTVPFVSIGSGKLLADPFLGFLRRIFWPSSLPTVGQGTLAAIWTLDQCIRTSYAFLAPPVHVAELKLSSGTFSARLLPPEDLSDHRQAIESAEKSLPDALKQKPTENASEIPSAQKSPP